MIPAICTEDAPAGIRISIAASRAGVFTLLKSSEGFRGAFSAAIAGAPYRGFFWETPPINTETAHLPFQCMIIPSAAVAALVADGAPFAGLIEGGVGADSIVCRPNLSGDGMVIIPCDGGEANYAHLAAFLRTSQATQIDQLWREVGTAVCRWLAETPERTLWLSTSGLGVSWLHIRLDTRPKYYSYAPYKASNA